MGSLCSCSSIGCWRGSLDAAPSAEVLPGSGTGQAVGQDRQWDRTGSPRQALPTVWGKGAALGLLVPGMSSVLPGGRHGPWIWVGIFHLVLNIPVGYILHQGCGRAAGKLPCQGFELGMWLLSALHFLCLFTFQIVLEIPLIDQNRKGINLFWMKL